MESFELNSRKKSLFWKCINRLFCLIHFWPLSISSTVKLFFNYSLIHSVKLFILLFNVFYWDTLSKILDLLRNIDFPNYRKLNFAQKCQFKTDTSVESENYGFIVFEVFQTYENKHFWTFDRSTVGPRS